MNRRDQSGDPGRKPSHPRRSHPPRGKRGPARPPIEDAARQAALDTLRAVRERDAYANLALPGLLRQRKITGRDAALATELAYGTSRAQGLLDAILAACIDRTLAKVESRVLDVLRLGAYQLLRTRIPTHAAVSATVDLMRAENGSGAAGFVNAVLRKVGARTEAEWVAELAPADEVGAAAFAHAHPLWIAEAFRDALGGTGELAAALAADDERPAIHLAARPGEISADELSAITGGDLAPYSPYGVHLETGAGDPGELDPVKEGLAVVQDEGSQLCALALTRVPVEGTDARWLDLCAGPGGKAGLLGALVRMQGGTLDAVEQSEHRAELVRKVTGDLPVIVHVADGRKSGLEPGFDRVLVDAPCTGLGALRRRPEARWRRSAEDTAELTGLQRDLLHAALDLVRPGGVVAYVLCSPQVSETREVVEAVLADRGDVEQLDTREYFPDVPQLGDGPHVQLWPHRQGTDAMFCSLLRKL
ncbi:rRNA small subunit methyltransferase B [Pseudonocardiaceae bacterium YIM PH 21723]|nr:rRNA small subunit methyltransferase B [Pseudonocardiaceae bacterium YIM PH 21723]